MFLKTAVTKSQNFKERYNSPTTQRNWEKYECIIAQPMGEVRSQNSWQIRTGRSNLACQYLLAKVVIEERPD